MQKFSTWMILAIAVVFWILRIIASYTNAMAIDFMIKPINEELEIALLFVALFCFVLIAKRKLLGVIVYIVAYWGYFGADLIKAIIDINSLSFDYVSALFSLVGVALPAFALFDWLLDRNKQVHPVDKKTDWFYKNKEYDRKLDERADKNNYRTL